MNREVDPALQDENIILVSEVEDDAVDEVAKQHAEHYLAHEVYEVPLAAIAFVHFQLQVHC
eukprot:CAMPEP_0170496978 /NCGR_PEP_ID=MMETSP0208-20121228/23324_1 /TAXON_ID=197538 /ORGANISM="Strombidium inclinatum, Strain S3" /LENGTH=60 /DNA_ID=CAMNT_0010773649 /DNA_START=522 /DNA_END=704 /DNA_ORIENTATION=+